MACASTLLTAVRFNCPPPPRIRAEFDPAGGLTNPGKGHYPQCLLITAYDVFRRQVRAAAIVPQASSERAIAETLVPTLPFGVQLYDRGFPSYDFPRMLGQRCKGYFLVRCPAKGSFGAVGQFVATGRRQDFIPIGAAQGHPGPALILRAEQMDTESQQEVHILRGTSATNVSSELSNLPLTQRATQCSS